MADAYVTTIYATAALALAAINAAATDKVVTVAPFMEGGKQKFMVVLKA
jgi:hypothetical protein